MRFGELFRRAVVRGAAGLNRARRLRLADELLILRHRILERDRQLGSSADPSIEPVIESESGERLRRSILESSPPWSKASVPEFDSPGMLTESERRYYWFITDFYSGLGECVELGPWLGLSTRILVEGLRRTRGFATRRLFVFDDFIWRSQWMLPALATSGLRAPVEHASFLSLFEEQTRSIERYLSVEAVKLGDFDGNEALPLVRWNGRPIELLIVDCGRSLSVNEAWWRAFSPSFIPNRTLIVMQDWQHFKNVPERPWENTKVFTDGKGSALDLVHEVANGGIGTFLFRGQA